MDSDDIGYSKTSLEWTYAIPTTGRDFTATFQAEYAEIGDRCIELLNAAKRTLLHKRQASIHNAVGALRRAMTAIAMHEAESNVLDNWVDAYIRFVDDDQSLTEGSKQTYFAHISPIFNEIARVRRERPIRANPFQRRSMSEAPLVHGDELAPLLSRANRDAYKIVTDFRNPNLSHIPFIQEAKSLSKGGLFIPGDTKAKSKLTLIDLARRWSRATGLELTDLTMHLYPSTHTMLPLLLLLSFAVVANPDSISLLRRSAVVPTIHPKSGPVLELKLDKPRAGEIPQIFVRDAGSLSEGWLVRAALEMSEYLVNLAPKRDKDYVFLCATRSGNIAPLIGGNRYNALKTYILTNGFPVTTLKALRTARLTDDWIVRRDPFRVWRLHGGSSIAIVAAYVNRAEAERADAASIAGVQAEIAARGTTKAESISGGRGVLSSHTCLDPSDPSKPHDEHGFCINYLWPYNDVHYILPLEPRPVAMLLRDYDTLCEAEKCLSPERFAVRYAAKKHLIEIEFLPQIDPQLEKEARAILAALPSDHVKLELL